MRRDISRVNINVDIVFLTTVVLVSLRFGAVFLLSPLFSVARIPTRFRVLFVVSLSALLVANIHPATNISSYDIVDLVSAGLVEFAIGAAMAFGMFSAFSVFLFGGRILDFQMGFGVANLIDPVTHAQSPLLGTVLNMTAVMTFLMLNGHHMVLRGLAYSLERMPPGTTLNEMDISSMVSQFGSIFVFGLAVVAPVVFALLFVDVGMAVAARTMPQVNVFIVSMPLKIFVGLVMLALSLNYIGPLMEKVYSSMFRYWEHILG